MIPQGIRGEELTPDGWVTYMKKEARTMPNRSNCFVAAITARTRIKASKLHWLPGWRNGFIEFFQSPWGHCFVELPDGRRISYDAINKDISVLGQLWFVGEWRHGRHTIGNPTITEDKRNE